MSNEEDPQTELGRTIIHSEGNNTEYSIGPLTDKSPNTSTIHMLGQMVKVVKLGEKKLKLSLNL